MNRPDVSSLVEIVLNQLGHKVPEDLREVTYLISEVSAATAGTLLVSGLAVYGAWRAWSYVREGCRTPDPLVRAFNLLGEMRSETTSQSSYIGRSPNQDGHVPSFLERVRDTRFNRYPEVTDPERGVTDWIFSQATSIPVVSQSDPDRAPELVPNLQQAEGVEPVPTMDCRSEGRVVPRVIPPPPPRAPEHVPDLQQTEGVESAPLGFAEQIRAQQALMKLRSSKELKN